MVFGWIQRQSLNGRNILPGNFEIFRSSLDFATSIVDLFTTSLVSRVAQPIHCLLHRMKNGRKLGLIGNEWQESQQHAFEEVINRFTLAPITLLYRVALKRMLYVLHLSVCFHNVTRMVGTLLLFSLVNSATQNGIILSTIKKC